ncbi:MAG: hypothetical protein ACI845_003559 [Gammaproteobacteria bacterium]|jgi:hypothetical protein
MNRYGNLIFCVASLLLTLGLSFSLYPYAKLSDSEVANLSVPKSMEEFDNVIDLGEDFGVLSMFELVGFYLDNPPNNDGTVKTEAERQFGGC